MFIILLLLTALLMEGIGSYISVVGLSSLFTGDIVIIFMAVILDIAKIVSVSFLYQNWTLIQRAMKYYMTSAVLILMLITSGGAFGYLSAAFQKSVQPNLEASMKVNAFSELQISLTTEKRELTDLKININKQIAAIPAENEKARRQLIYSLKPELDQTNKRLEIVNKQLDDIRAKSLAAKSDNLTQDVHAGPIIYVSKAFDVSIEEASKYIILVIVGVFDPLAIMLVLAANFLIKRRNEEEKLNPVVPEPELPKIEPIPAPKPSIYVPDDLVLEPVQIEKPVITSLVPESEAVEPVVEPIEVSESIPEPIPETVVEVEPEVVEPIEVSESIPEPIPETPIQEPVVEPVVEVEINSSFSGSPQSEFIHVPLPVTLTNQGIVLK